MADFMTWYLPLLGLPNGAIASYVLHTLDLYPLNVKGYVNYHLTVALIAIVMDFGKQLSYLPKHMITFNFIVTQVFKWSLCVLTVHSEGHSMASDTSCMRIVGSPHIWAELEKLTARWLLRVAFVVVTQTFPSFYCSWWSIADLLIFLFFCCNLV